MTLRILPTTDEHVDGFHAVFDTVAKERRYLAFLEAPPLEELRGFVRWNIERGHPQCVALADGRVVGWCDIVPVDRPTRAHTGVLGVAVLPDFRGQGIGTALVRECLHMAQAVGLTRIELTVREHNARVVSLYERFGFAVEGLQPNAIRVDGKYESLVCMGLILNSRP